MPDLAIIAGIDANRVPREVLTEADGTVDVKVTSAALPTGAATEATLATTKPAQSGAAVTPSDSTVLTGVRALWVGGAGNLTLTGQDGVDYVLQGVAAGTLLPVACTKVKAATTATLIVALT